MQTHSQRGRRSTTRRREGFSVVVPGQSTGPASPRRRSHGLASDAQTCGSAISLPEPNRWRWPRSDHSPLKRPNRKAKPSIIHSERYAHASDMPMKSLFSCWKEISRDLKLWSKCDQVTVELKRKSYLRDSVLDDSRREKAPDSELSDLCSCLGASIRHLVCSDVSLDLSEFSRIPVRPPASLNAAGHTHVLGWVLGINNNDDKKILKHFLRRIFPTTFDWKSLREDLKEILKK